MIRSLFSWLLLLACGTGNLRAQIAARKADDPRDAMLQQLAARVASLEAEVRELRAEKTRAPATPRKEGERDKAAIMDTPMMEGEPVESQAGAPEPFPRLKIRGFADVDYHLGDRGADRNAFRFGQLALCFTSQLADDLTLMNEDVIEPDDANHFGFEAERLLLQWTPRDYFNVAVGRYHTAIGYYNNAFHHGKWLQTAVGRPRIFNFEDEDGLLPIHNVGVSVSGVVPSGALGLHYVAEVGNGRNYTPGQEPVQNLSDNNQFKAVNLAVFARPDLLPGFQAGGSIYFDRVNVDALPTADQTIAAVHAVYLSPLCEWLNEAVLIHDTSNLGTFDTRAFYTQVARQFGDFRPYIRFQLLDADSHDPLLIAASSPAFSETLSLGVRYNFAEFAALKLQGDHTFSPDEGLPGNELTLQVSFTF